MAKELGGTALFFAKCTGEVLLDPGVAGDASGISATVGGATELPVAVLDMISKDVNRPGGQLRPQ